jgi:hypothetical protein
MSFERIRRIINSQHKEQPAVKSQKINEAPVIFEKMKIRIISFYADFMKNDYYKNFALSLADKCKRFGVTYDISELESRSNYGANCLMKPEFILKKIKEYRAPLIWMDCDTDFKLPFSQFNNIKEDIGLATHSGDMEGIKASPVYFNYTPGSFKILREWVVHTRAAYVRGINELDHDALKHYVLPVLNGQYSVFLLSDNWNDFVNGKYIVNGNSRVEGKNEIHQKVHVDDATRYGYTAGVKKIKVLFNDTKKNVFSCALNFLDNFSNYNRLEFYFLNDASSHTGNIRFKQLEIESGGNIYFSDDFLDIKADYGEIILSVSNIEDIQPKWDLKIWDEISMMRNPLHSLTFTGNGLGKIQIKTISNSWI